MAPQRHENLCEICNAHGNEDAERHSWLHAGDFDIGKNLCEACAYIVDSMDVEPAKQFLMRFAVEIRHRGKCDELLRELFAQRLRIEARHEARRQQLDDLCHELASSVFGATEDLNNDDVAIELSVAKFTTIARSFLMAVEMVGR